MNVERVDKVKLEVKQDMTYSSRNAYPNKLRPKNVTPVIKLDSDTVSISDEAKSLLAQDKNWNMYDEKSRMLSELLRQLEDMNKPSENSYMDKVKCIQIAIRIINGDKVPYKDRKFLMEKEPEMYSKAILFRRENDKPKKYKGLVEDDEEDEIVISTSSDSTTEASDTANDEVEGGGD